MWAGTMIGVSQNQKVRTTLTICAVSRRYTWRLEAIQPKPTANSPIKNRYAGKSKTANPMA
jgi:hypothetical protein